MEYKVLFTVFTAVFIAELGDKTQLATMLFAADKEASKLMVFFGALLALIVTSGIGVLVGGAISEYIVSFRQACMKRATDGIKLGYQKFYRRIAHDEGKIKGGATPRNSTDKIFRLA